MQDRNFDDIAEKFSRNIYGTTKGRIRQAVLGQDLHDLLQTLPQRPLRILDAGGGEGQMACELAALGHKVLLCDLSGEMIRRAEAAAREKGVSDNMQFVQCPAQHIAEHLEQPVDLILFHAVIEWLAEPQHALAALVDCLAPGGAISLMFYNIHGLVMRHMILGNFAHVEAGVPKIKKSSLLPDHPLEPAKVYQWLEQLGCRSAARPVLECSTIICETDNNINRILMSFWRWNSVIVVRNLLLVWDVTST